LNMAGESKRRSLCSVDASYRVLMLPTKWTKKNLGGGKYQAKFPFIIKLIGL